MGGKLGKVTVNVHHLYIFKRLVAVQVVSTALEPAFTSLLKVNAHAQITVHN